MREILTGKPVAPNFKLTGTDTVQLRTQAGKMQMSDIYKTVVKAEGREKKNLNQSPDLPSPTGLGLPTLRMPTKHVLP